ncbi:MAG: TVP38/TMEM64 family protein [Rhodobacterales bacterium]
MTYDTQPQSGKPKTLIRRFLPLALILVALAGIYLSGLHEVFTIDWLSLQRDSLTRLVTDHYALVLAGFALAYALAVATAFPAASFLTVAGGFMFGWLVGGVTVVLSATAGATILFLIARTSFGAGLRSMAGPRVNRLADGFEKNAFLTIVALRLAPVFPFFLMNIIPALFRVPVTSYAAATLIGIAPGTFAYAYLGSGVDSVLTNAEAAGERVEIADLVTPQLTLAFVALAAVAALPIVVRMFFPRKIEP